MRPFWWWKGKTVGLALLFPGVQNGLGMLWSLFVLPRSSSPSWPSVRLACTYKHKPVADEVARRSRRFAAGLLWLWKLTGRGRCGSSRCVSFLFVCGSGRTGRVVEAGVNNSRRHPSLQQMMASNSGVEVVVVALHLLSRRAHITAQQQPTAAALHSGRLILFAYRGNGSFSRV